MSSEIQFQEVVSNSSTEGEPLGTLAGRGINVGQKGLADAQAAATLSGID